MCGCSRSGSGSSPRVRGKLGDRRCPAVPGGLIPACAGKTPTADLQIACKVAHPRVCGENLVINGDFDGNLGSSPRVRGKRREHWLRSASLGLIPACAGKTAQELAGALSLPGLIPACAGKTYRTAPPSAGRRAHPRVCGENSPSTWPTPDWVGSSPRVRGKPDAPVHAGQAAGLIPACAGKTGPAREMVRRPWAHPRVCGENFLAPGALDQDLGSSPRVRGKRVRLGEEPVQRGLIPACAGKTIDPAPEGPLLLAHPRVCGEN